MHISVGGNTVRVIVTNEFGMQPLTIGAANIALRTKGSVIDLASAKTVTFGGQPLVILPAGSMMLSDPIDMTLGPLSDVVISLFVPAQPMRQSTVHSYALQTNYKSPGNVVSAETLTTASTTGEYFFVRGLEVMSGAPAAVVTLGDSITDGAASDANMNGRWPNVLAARLQADAALSGIGVLNAGLNGNRLLHNDDEFGDSALKRLDRDVLTQAGARYLIVLEGINDIGHIAKPSVDDPPETAQSIIRALQQIAARARSQGIKVIGATILPYENCKYASVNGEKMRQAVNQWIRSSQDFDAVVDFDKVVRDPVHPGRLLPAYDSGDHLHPNTDGLRAMANSIPLSFFAR
ncbi:MAG TPA: SGNH/GDSL hydrolase family protein [Acidobacteriaceae bacterium]|nr:SGNH/GDSL hydrolase family protein [Acidobacteriaceae bacterium]